METSRNQGKSLKARNLSWSSIRTQKPCSETFVTSGAEVRAPSRSDFILVLPNKAQHGPDPVCAETMILGEFDDRLQPDLHFAVRMVDMNVHPHLFPREEEEPETSLLEDRRTHGRMLRDIQFCSR